jgi:hypothetical protein
MNILPKPNPEQARLAEGIGTNEVWRRWGPFLSDRQWSTVREDYSADGTAWEYFPHDHARSRAYRVRNADRPWYVSSASSARASRERFI